MDIVCSQFGKTVFILITDMNKMGTLVSGLYTVVTADNVIPQMAVDRETEGPQSQPIFSVRTLLGHDKVCVCSI